MSFSREELAKLNRKELQVLCKKNGIKANKKTDEILNELVTHFRSEERDLLKLEIELEDSDDLNTTWTIDDGMDKENKVNIEHSDSRSNEENDKLKEDLMKEVDKRTEEKLSKIPRFVVDNMFIPNVSTDPATPVANKKEKEKSYGVQMDSIDKYLVKKRERAQEQLTFNERFKESRLPLKKLENLKSPETKVARNKRKSIKIDNEITFNVGQPQSKPVRRISPRLHNSKRESNKKSIWSTVNPDRKTAKDRDRKDKKDKNGKHFTMANFSSPALNLTASKQKTPKFDLQESLKKPLNYKPHTGKLKEVYFVQESNVLPRKLLASNDKRSKMQVSVKMMTKNVTTRKNRRSEAATKRGNKRNDILAKRRGIEF